MLVACIVALLPRATSAQGGVYDVRQTDSNSSQYDEGAYRHTREQRRSQTVGRTFVGMIGQEAHNVRTRIQWASVGWGITDDLVGTSYFEQDFGDHVSLRVSGTFGFTTEDTGREIITGGEAGFWFHTRSLEPTFEQLVLNYNVDSSTDYSTYRDSDDDRYDRSATTHLSTSATTVTVPGYRSRMIGAELGLGTWWGLHSTREGGARFDRALTGYAYAGFSSGWIKSSMYYVAGYGTIGRSRYHKAYIHLMYAPLIVYADIDDVDESLQPSNFPFGLRLGVENFIGRRSALTFRAELLAMPAGGVGMLVLSLGFGSMFVSTS